MRVCACCDGFFLFYHSVNNMKNMRSVMQNMDIKIVCEYMDKTNKILSPHPRSSGGRAKATLSEVANFQ